MGTEVRLTLAPQRRFEAIDVNTRVADEAGDVLKRHQRALYCSFHTTAGYLDQSLSVRLRDSQDQLSKFFRTFRSALPPWRGVPPRPDGAAHGVERRAEESRAAQRRLASDLHRRGPQELRHLSHASRRAGLLHRAGRQERGHAAPADDDRAGVRRRTRRLPDVADHSGLEASDRLGEPRRPAPRPPRAGERAARRGAVSTRGAWIWSSPQTSATSG